MRPFNCLSSESPIFGPHLLEASAGTGKTFSIEHVFVRLLLESEIEVEQILAVTFTRAATRDLKKRIRANIREAQRRISTEMTGWEYLNPYLGSEKASRKLEDGLLGFDRCQIFTIHGFCHRMLQEFAFEADLGFALRNPERQAAIPKRLHREAIKFLENGIGPDLLCPEQMLKLLKKFDSFDALARHLLKKDKECPAIPYAVLLERYRAALAQWKGGPIEEAKLLDAFNSVSDGYKSAVKGDFEIQIKAIASGSFRELLREEGSLFSLLDASNKKVRAKVECPEFFDWASRTIMPIIQEAMDRKKILGCLQTAWMRIEAPILAEEQCFDPDEILKQMKIAVDRNPFAACIRKKYAAVIIDEFQDTDAVQWDIFKILFLQASMPLRALYLVGDPKQSIYRFRKADIYTYFNARESLGEEALFCLDTNYRSSSPMIDALNSLFDRNWLALPKLNRTILSPSVKAGAKNSFDFPDVHGAVHFIAGHSFEESFLPYAVSEIERLSAVFPSPSSFAVLVKDRYEAETALHLFQERSIPAIAKSHEPLSKTLAFQSLHELFKALSLPRDVALRRLVKAGPFGSIRLNALEKQNLVSLCRQIANYLPDSEFRQDFNQVVEELFTWERSCGFSLQGMIRFMEEFAELQSNEGGRRRVEIDAEAVQILTLHVSKGLEFDVVFALGLSTRPPTAEEDEEEVEAEKLRQLYVAMTRAKLRLYVPIIENSKAHGSSSPMEMFCRILELQEGGVLPFLSRTKHVTLEYLPEKVSLPPPSFKRKNQDISSPTFSAPPFSPSLIQSFTSLAKLHASEIAANESPPNIFTAHTIPGGVGTGILIHQIFESLFSSKTPVWRNLKEVEALVEEHLTAASLLSWKQTIQEMVWKTLHLPLVADLSLKKLEPGQLQAEMEFLYPQPPHYIKGFIDLVFMFDGKIYFLDWKTNWLGPDDESYASLDNAMSAHDYWLQAKLYSEALRRHVKRFYTQPFEEIFGGAIYIFLRGGGVCHFKP